MIFHPLILAVITEAAPIVPAPAEETGVAVSVAIATALLIAAVVLLLVEFVVVSGGMLGVGAIGCACASIFYAFSAGDLVGWVFSVLVPVCGVISLRSGLGWLKHSSMVTQAEITAEAGYHHAFAGQGIEPGAEGELLTDAHPTGRARFQGTTGPVEIDVTLRGGGVEPGARVVIKAIEGPVVFAIRAVTPSPAQPS